MSVSLPSRNGNLRPIRTFYSGHIDSTKNTPMGSINRRGKPINLMGDGSITKSFTAAIILQLESENKIKLNDTLGKYLPQYSDWSSVTIRQLLNMTAGIFDYSNDSTAFEKKLASNIYQQWSPEELIKFSYNNTEKSENCPKGGNTCFAPGAGYYYSNADYILLEMIISKITGHTFEQEIYDRLLGPSSRLGRLNNTYYVPDTYPAGIALRMVRRYDPTLGDITFMNMSWAGPAGANISNTADLVDWARLLFQTREVLPEQQSNMLTQLICADKKILLCLENRFNTQANHALLVMAWG